MTDLETIAATVAHKRELIGQWEERMRAIGRSEDEIAAVSGWDRAVADLVEGIAERHSNTPLVGAANPRGYCTQCGGWFGTHCPDLAGVLAVCAAWHVAMGDPIVQLGLSDLPPVAVAASNEGDQN